MDVLTLGDQFQEMVTDPTPPTPPPASEPTPPFPATETVEEVTLMQPLPPVSVSYTHLTLPTKRIV